MWRGGTRITLPPGGTPLYLNNQGVIAGLGRVRTLVAVNLGLGFATIAAATLLR